MLVDGMMRLRGGSAIVRFTVKLPSNVRSSCLGQGSSEAPPCLIQSATVQAQVRTAVASFSTNRLS
eukprot:COSAG02_NODE_52809_length_305_cov_1.257282_1_plen_65_part_01